MIQLHVSTAVAVCSCGCVLSTNRRREATRAIPCNAKFAFDHVFPEQSSQLQVFQKTTKPILQDVLSGHNVSVFAYGATGAGKTHTMLGHGGEPGIIVLTMVELFEQLRQRSQEYETDLSVSYLEVYNETIRDLLNPSVGVLNLRESGDGVVMALLTKGNQNRTQHPTDANATSSRSHAVFQLHVKQTPRNSGTTAHVLTAKMSLIDLAGSERASATSNRGARMREGANINKSLLALGSCINALASTARRKPHVPYRNSKLTRLLKDSLGGNTRTIMLANVSPSYGTYDDTFNTLQYAKSAKNIKKSASAWRRTRPL
ncbi:uncharacterized protein MONBRDRAFT_28757 [Monosiga brevicollis MX1]|uniref:Kinesin-like protein n=1 Tax=Monosiga brevicollis TaxID=81824 RepID=A9V937_MONBE|nr:uncharacterized protein MONBRDRAFT_28757 [Monosiga brevicollis MX1]EDQ85986.1 predicted protein [Monosiga brevicollis MX1]|eukprot:XP_001749180.1 hypothetical protein [Monosiga brevicollis MX1]